MFTVLVEGLQLYAYHGVPDAERELGHRYLIDLKLEVDGQAFDTDEVSDTVDYGAAARVAQAAAEKQQYRTVERLARVIGEELLSTFELLEAAEVMVRKPMPPAPFLASHAGVVVRSQRDPR